MSWLTIKTNTEQYLYLVIKLYKAMPRMESKLSIPKLLAQKCKLGSKTFTQGKAFSNVVLCLVYLVILIRPMTVQFTYS